MSESFEQWSNSYNIMNAIFEWTVLRPLFILLVGKFIRQYVGLAHSIRTCVQNPLQRGISLKRRKATLRLTWTCKLSPPHLRNLWCHLLNRRHLNAIHATPGDVAETIYKSAVTKSLRCGQIYDDNNDLGRASCKGFTSSPVKLGDHSGVRIHRQPCKIWLLTWRRFVRSRRERSMIRTDGPINAETQKIAVLGEGLL